MKPSFGIFCVVVLIASVDYVLPSTITGDSPIVTTIQGSLKGKVLTSLRGRPFFAYQGIPYARPPLAHLRFKPPEPPEPWEGVRDAQKEGSICPQLDLILRKYGGDEDCLFLNVYTPKLPKAGEPVSYDVLFWIHGGGFAGGSGNTDFYGPEHFMDKDIVLVTFNYRVGALGFLSTGDEASPGNYGMKDQVLALKWVHQNIEAFGGNPHSVTVFGESAGSSSVHYHILSPLSKGLFHRAISQSGTALNFWAFSSKAKSRHLAFKLGEVLGCKTENSEELVSCMRNIDDFTKFAIEVPKLKEWLSDFFFPFVPTTDDVLPEGNAFLPLPPMEMIAKGDYNAVPWIIGVNSHEGLFTSTQIVLHPLMFQQFREKFDKIAPVHMGYKDTSPEESREITRKLREFYFGNKPVSQKTFSSMVNMESDNKFLEGVYRTVKEHLVSSSTPIFFYELSYIGRFGFMSQLDQKNLNGVSHADDLLYLFRNSMMKTEIGVNDPEMITVDRMVSMWTDFAKYGNPTPENTSVAVVWDPVTSEEIQYLVIGSDLKMKEGFYPERMKFWETFHEFHSAHTFKDEL